MRRKKHNLFNRPLCWECKPKLIVCGIKGRKGHMLLLVTSSAALYHFITQYSGPDSGLTRIYIYIYTERSCAPLSKNEVFASQIPNNLLPFTRGRFMKKLADDQCFSITKGSIYHYKTYLHTSFYHIVEWPGGWYLMEVSTMLFICRYCAFTLWDSSSVMESSWYQSS